jgi:hypothetical protein
MPQSAFHLERRRPDGTLFAVELLKRVKDIIDV